MIIVFRNDNILFIILKDEKSTDVQMLDTIPKQGPMVQKC